MRLYSQAFFRPFVLPCAHASIAPTILKTITKYLKLAVKVSVFESSLFAVHTETIKLRFQNSPQSEAFLNPPPLFFIDQHFRFRSF